MDQKPLYMGYLNLRTGGICKELCNDGIYLKSIVKENGDATAFFPTFTSVSVYDGIEFYGEMKLNLFKRQHPDFERQRENVFRILHSLGIERAYTTRLLKDAGLGEIAVADEDGIYLPRNGHMVLPDSYDLRREDRQFAANALMTDKKHIAIMMYAADCPTAFMRDRVTGAICVLHSMWRGMVVNEDGPKLTSIVEKAVEGMGDTYGTNPEDLDVTIFPCIGVEQYVVKGDVINLFEIRGLDTHIYEDDKKEKHLDLTGAMIELFQRSGVLRESIETTRFRTADYGFNSLRMAPTSYIGEPGMTGYELPETVADTNHEIVLTPSDELEKTKVRPSALNFLIALRR